MKINEFDAFYKNVLSSTEFDLSISHYKKYFFNAVDYRVDYPQIAYNAGTYIGINIDTGLVLVGSTTELGRRIRKIVSSVERNVFPNKLLQSHYSSGYCGLKWIVAIIENKDESLNLANAIQLELWKRNLGYISRLTLTGHKQSDVGLKRHYLVYRLVHSRTNKYYIGSSSHLSVRLRQHKNQCKYGIHHNTHLLKITTEENDFEFKNWKLEILEICSSREEAFQVEERLLKKGFKEEPDFILNESECSTSFVTSDSKATIKDRLLVKRNLSRKAIKRNAIKNKLVLNRKQIIIDDTTFQSITDASRILGISTLTIRKRINSQNPKWVKYEYAI